MVKNSTIIIVIQVKLHLFRNCQIIVIYIYWNRWNQ